MNDSDFERLLTGWLDQGPVSAPREAVEAALAETATLPQAKVLGLPWARWPGLTLPDAQALARAALSLAVIVLAIAGGMWAVNNLPPPPASSPSPSPSPSPSGQPIPTAQPTPSATPGAGPTQSPAPTPTGAATPAQPLLPEPVLAATGQAGRQNLFGASVTYELAIANIEQFVPDFFDPAPEFLCPGGGVATRTIVEIRDGDTDTLLAQPCSEVDPRALVLEMQLGHPLISRVYVELIDRLSDQTARSATIELPAPEWPPLTGPVSSPQVVAAGSFDDLTVAPDGEGGVHIFGAIAVGAGTQRGVIHFAQAEGSWSAQQVTVAPAGVDDTEYDGEVDAAADTDGTIWLAFTRYSCGGCVPTLSDGIYVMNSGGGEWSEPVLVAGAESHAGSIAVRDGVVHLAYTVGQSPASPPEVYYATNATGAWVSRLIAEEAHQPQLALRGDGLPWFAYLTTDGVRLAIADGGGSFTVEQPPSAGTDSIGRLLFDTVGDDGYFLWTEDGGTHYRASRRPDGWTQPESVRLGDQKPDAMIVDPGSPVVMYTSGRSSLVTGAWIWTGSGDQGGAVALMRGEATMTDIIDDGRRAHMVFAYASPLGPSAIYYYHFARSTE